MSEPLVILPGLLCDSRMFGAQIAAFGAQVLDGFYDGATRIGTMAEQALDRMPARCALLGHSMGARIALEILRVAPHRVARLALANTGIHPVQPGEAERRHALRDIGRTDGAEALVDRWLPPMIGRAHRDDPAIHACLRAMAVDAGVAIFSVQIEALLNRPDPRPLLPAIDCPTYAIVGRDDEWSPIAQHEDIVARIPGAQLRIVDNAGHMAPAEEPDAFNIILREWLAHPADQ